MRDRLTGKNINLEKLAEVLKEFFENRKFKVKLEKSSGYRILAVPKRGMDLCDSIEVCIRGKPEDFEITFNTVTDFTSNFIRLGGLTILFGGGLLLRKGLKSQEELDRLEKDFWKFFDAAIATVEQKG